MAYVPALYKNTPKFRDFEQWEDERTEVGMYMYYNYISLYNNKLYTYYFRPTFVLLSHRFSLFRVISQGHK